MTVSFATTTVTVVRPGWTTSRGDEVPDWDTATEHLITGCRLQPQTGEAVTSTGTGEGGARRRGVGHRRILFAPPGADLDTHDRVRVDGETFVVDGPVRRWPSPTGLVAHDEADLRRVEG